MARPHIFRSSDTGTIPLNNTAGSLCTVLDAILVDGYNSQTLTSITRTGSTATATKTSHGFVQGQLVTISGATETEYNVTKAEITYLTADTFSYAVTGTPTTPATGTITAIVAPVGFTIAYTATNERSYARPAGSNGFYLNITDTSGTTARIRMFETVTAAGAAAVNGTNPTPTDAQASGGLYCYKAASTNREWIAIAHADQFYFWNVFNANTLATGTVNWLMIGDMVGDYSGAYATFLSASYTASQPLPGFDDAYFGIANDASSVIYMLRAASPASTKCNMVAFGHGSYMGYENVIPIAAGLHVSPIRVHLYAGAIYGLIPGVVVPGCAKPYSALDTFTTGAGSPLGAREFIVITGSSGQPQSQIFVDISTDWTT